MAFKGRIQLRPRRLRINITWNISTIGNFDVQNVVYYNAKFLSISELFVSPRAYKPQTAKKFLKRISNIREEHGFRRVLLLRNIVTLQISYGEKSLNKKSWNIFRNLFVKVI